MSDFIENLFIFLSIFVVAALMIFSLAFFIGGGRYLFDKSMCTAYVEDQQVYQGRCHFLSISSVGENGNTKRLIIYKDKYGLQPLKKYVNENIKVQDVENDNRN